MTHPDMIESGIPLPPRRYNRPQARQENQIFDKLKVGESVFFPAPNAESKEARRAVGRLQAARKRLKGRTFVMRWRLPEDEAAVGRPAQSGVRIWREE